MRYTAQISCSTTGAERMGAGRMDAGSLGAGSLGAGSWGCSMRAPDDSLSGPFMIALHDRPV